MRFARQTTRALSILTWLAGVAGALAAEAGVSLDLNRLETQGAACRVTLVVVNGPAAAEELKTDLVMFGTDGVVARRLAVDLAPLAARKTIVKMFDIPGTACAGVGSILLNDVPACRFAGGALSGPACLAGIAVSSHAPIRFFK